MAKSIFALGAEFSALSVQLGEAVKQQMITWKEREDRWAQLDKKVEQVASQAPSKVVLDVGGKKFATSKSTLLSMPDTFFTAMLCSDRWKPNDKGAYFIDRNPKHFGRILDYLRYGKLRVADLSAEQMECLEEELDFYQITDPTKQQITPVSFISTADFNATNNNQTIKRITQSKHVQAIRLNKELNTGKRYEWTIRLDAIEGSYWIAVGVGDINTKNYGQMYGISSQDQVVPSTKHCTVSGDWETGDLIHTEYNNLQVIISNKRTGRSHTVQVPSEAIMYPFFDVYAKGLTITVVHFK
eukprot:Phypoly_transcript_09729.p1 GENE.Phypoly_transcript_09729~~Phypoly_transcript_09729.p1  ORF type:complete len:299 (+),score=33.98 Phypoly_transcript_09729:120-1016(+)